ncbi:MAG: hypothetical protein EBT99_15035 [Betaproteobacteria bacterium]|nr:hypothetical protein [Betaproteobacteria bacterium]NBT82782.1 hypothetical protein [Betaproteobacteria bacterium]
MADPKAQNTVIRYHAGSTKRATFDHFINFQLTRTMNAATISYRHQDLAPLPAPPIATSSKLLTPFECSSA